MKLNKFLIKCTLLSACLVSTASFGSDIHDAEKLGSYNAEQTKKAVAEATKNSASIFKTLQSFPTAMWDKCKLHPYIAIACGVTTVAAISAAIYYAYTQSSQETSELEGLDELYQGYNDPVLN